MSNDQSGLSGIDNLTPFEYALAGVAPTTNQESPSLLVIESMRALADEVQDAPITQARLQDLMRTGGSAASRSDRRIRKRRRAAAASGGFVDITPVELTGQPTGERGAPADGGQRGESEELISPIAFVEADPTSEQPAIGPTDESDLEVAEADIPEPLSDFDPSPAEFASDTSDLASGEDVVDHPSVDLESGPETGVESFLETEQSGGPSALPPDFDDQDFAREFDAIQQAMFDPDIEDPQLFEEPVEALDPTEGSDDLAAVLRDLPPPTLDAAAPPLDDEGDEEEEDSLFTQTGDHEVRDASGRFAGLTLFDPEEPLTAEEPEPGTAVFVPATGGEEPPSVLDTDSDDERQPLAVAALTGTIPAPARTRRFGGAFWALAGTAAAAAVLALGGLLWANSLEDPEQTETADAAIPDEVVTDEQTPSEGNEDGETSAAATLGEASDPSGEERPPLTVDGDDSAATTIDPASPTVTTTEDGDETGTTDGSDTTLAPTTTDAPGTTEPPTTTTVATTESTTTTEVTTTEAPTTLPPTTEPPTTTTTTAPPPTLPPPTLPPEPPPSFIGDRVTLGGFNGPGVADVRVRLLRDFDSNGTGDQLVGTDTTNEGGYYGFDDYDAGCYVVQFSQIPSGTTLVQGQEQQRVCLHEGGDNGRIDAVVEVTPPAGCLIEVADGRSDRGVEVYEGDWILADSYTFYGRNGGVVVKTRNLGPPDTDDNERWGDYEWFAPENGFNHRSVYSVAAEEYGIESAPVTCERQ